ncbi:MAG: PaaI family thioesterase [Candidatus Sericytochromatia bacterium]|nr:PaaI family thioesterase [Candidatus Tanganyikabacteria bacterium]
MTQSFTPETFRDRGLLPPAETLSGALGITFLQHEAGHVVARMPVHGPTRQPYGAMHGGALSALAEEVSSFGTVLGVDLDTHVAFGQEYSISLLRTVWEGWVQAEGKAIHRGRTAWVWDIRITDPEGRLVAISRGTVAIRPRREG